MLNTGLDELETAIFFLFEASVRSRALTRDEEGLCRTGLPHTSYSAIINALVHAFKEKVGYARAAGEVEADDVGDVREHVHDLLLHALQPRYISANEYAWLQEFVWGNPARSSLEIFTAAMREAIGCAET